MSPRQLVKAEDFMGTRSLTYVYDGEHLEAPVTVMYRQYDGYPSGHGVDLVKFLKDMVVVNGISSNAPPKIANGAGCLAAQLISNFKISEKTGKPEVGGIYVQSVAGAADPNNLDCWQDYTYRIYASDKAPINVVVEEGKGKILFRGVVEDFEIFCTSED